MFRKMCPSTTSCWFPIMKAAKKCWRPNVAHMQGSGVQIPTCRRFRKVATRIIVTLHNWAIKGWRDMCHYMLGLILKAGCLALAHPKNWAPKPPSLEVYIRVVRKERTIFQPLPFFRGELSNLGCIDIVVCNHCHPCTQEKNESACVVQMFG